MPESEWEIVNRDGSPAIEVIIFEGWCVGFHALSDLEVESKWKEAKAKFETQGSSYQGQLGKLKLSDVLFVNENLRRYDVLTDKFGAFIMM